MPARAICATASAKPGARKREGQKKFGEQEKTYPALCGMRRGRAMVRAYLQTDEKGLRLDERPFGTTPGTKRWQTNCMNRL